MNVSTRRTLFPTGSPGRLVPPEPSPIHPPTVSNCVHPSRSLPERLVNLLSPCHSHWVSLEPTMAYACLGEYICLHSSVTFRAHARKERKDVAHGPVHAPAAEYPIEVPAFTRAVSAGIIGRKIVGRCKYAMSSKSFLCRI